MTPVQSQSYEYVASGVDCVAQSRTGTGKTFAFGLPLIEKLVAQGDNRKDGRDGLPLVLILEPTRELAIQVAQELSLVCREHHMYVEAFYGGSSYSFQERSLRKGLHILVATPGRCLDHISRGTLDLSYVQTIVLDEGDTMLEMGFQQDVENIMANVKTPGEDARQMAAASLDSYGDEEDYYDNNNDYYDNNDDEMFDDDSSGDSRDSSSGSSGNSNSRDVQTLLFSATMPAWICSLTDKHMKEPVFLDAIKEGETRLAPTIEHLALRLPPVHENSRLEGVSAFVEDIILTRGKGGQTIVFTNTKEEADKLSAAACFGNFNAQVIHGDIGQNSRQNTIKNFKEGTVEVLVATDVAARGLDIAGVDLVVHTCPPGDSDTYVHRSGRTGRAGRNGTSVLLYSGREERRLGHFENDLNFKFTKVGPPSAREIAASCATFAVRRLDRVNPEVVDHFKPHALAILESLERRREGNENNIDNDDENDDEIDDNDTSSEMLIARCLAAISNRNQISSRSTLTGEPDMISIEFHAKFKNGTSPGNTRDWRKLIVGVFARSMGIRDVRFGKVVMAHAPLEETTSTTSSSTDDIEDTNENEDYGDRDRDRDRSSSSRGDKGGWREKRPRGQVFAIADLPYKQGQEVLSMAATTALPGGVIVRQCEVLPDIIIERYDDYGGGRYNDRGGRSGRGRGGGRDFDRGRRGYGGRGGGRRGSGGYRDGDGGGSGRRYSGRDGVEGRRYERRDRSAGY